jgi:hypothetical protein
MVRIGFYTGRIYDSKYDPCQIRECCAMVDVKEPVRNDHWLIKAKRKELKERCRGCCGCVEALEGDTIAWRDRDGQPRDC